MLMNHHLIHLEQDGAFLTGGILSVNSPLWSFLRSSEHTITNFSSSSSSPSPSSSLLSFSLILDLPIDTFVLLSLASSTQSSNVVPVLDHHNRSFCFALLFTSLSLVSSLF